MLKMLRTNPDLRRIFIAQVISYLGDWFSFVALVGLVDDLTGSSFLVSLVIVSFYQSEIQGQRRLQFQ